MVKILIVDDSAFLRRILKEYLSKKRAGSALADGCSLFESGTKEDALKKFREEQPDIVFLDIVMDRSDHDGIDVLIEMMRSKRQPKVIMMSAIGQERIIEECNARGAAGYILKPFDEQQVLTALECVLAADQAAETLDLTS